MITNTVSCLLGLIAASCGHLEAILQGCGHGSKTLIANGTSNGHMPVKAQQNGFAFKTPNGLVNGVHSNGNGTHL